jgi:signal transduction histidine kinase
MQLFRRYLTTKNLLSWQVVAVSVGILLSGHLLDTPLNGTENVPERAALLVANQAALFFVLWVCDRLFFHRIPESFRWVVLWGTVTLVAACWAVIFTWQLWQLGFTDTFDFAPRIRGWLMSLSVLTVVVALFYGLVAESARLQRQQSDIQDRIAKVRSMGARRKEADSAVIADIRSQLQDMLAPGPGDSAEKTLHALRSAIDEIIRPMTKTLNEQGSAPDLLQITTRVPISWRNIGKKFPDFAGPAVVPGAALFVVSSFPSVSTLMGVGPATVVLLLIFLQLIVTTFILIRLSRLLPRTYQSMALPVVFVVSSGFGAVVFWSLIPWGQPLMYFLAFIFRYTLCSLIAVVMAIAFDENRRTSQAVARNKADVDWALARVHELDHYHNQLISSVLHGKWQAVLAAAAARLQIALRDGQSVEDAVELARAEADHLSLDDFYPQKAPSSLGDALEQTVSLWKGVADISWQPGEGVVELIDSDPVCARLCSELILELCTNAIKHAGATHILVSVSMVDHRVVRLVVRNNGKPYVSGLQGYGSRLLDHSCVHWSIEADHGDTIVAADLPWASADKTISTLAGLE